MYLPSSGVTTASGGVFLLYMFSSFFISPDFRPVVLPYRVAMASS